MSNPYKNFLIEKGDYTGCIESEAGFLLYKIYNDDNGKPLELRIGELHIEAEFRKSGKASELANKATLEAAKLGCKWLSCNTPVRGREDDRVSMISILSYGFVPYTSREGEVTFLKEVK